MIFDFSIVIVYSMGSFSTRLRNLWKEDFRIYSHLGFGSEIVMLQILMLLTVALLNFYIFVICWASGVASEGRISKLLQLFLERRVITSCSGSLKLFLLFSFDTSKRFTIFCCYSSSFFLKNWSDRSLTLLIKQFILLLMNMFGENIPKLGRSELMRLVTLSVLKYYSILGYS